jgi:hypothetical protein
MHATLNAQRSTFNVQGVALGVLLAVCRAFADTVTWTDGHTWEGTVELGESAQVRLHDGKRVRAWPLEEIAGIAFRPSTQDMERAWVFKEAGKTAKEFTGEPYPTLELQSAVSLRNGETVGGHLLTTVFYLSRSNRTEKLVLKFKLRGREGETYSNLVYVARIRLGEAAPGSGGAAGSGHASVRVAGVDAKAELSLVSRRRMQEAEVKRVGPGAFRVEVDGGDLIPAVREHNRICVGWKGEAAPAARRRIEQGLRDLKDFFDERTLLAISQEPSDETTCHTLLLLSRAARTTMDGPKTQPWRLELWKWRLGSETNDITAASRCVLFRGIREPGAPLPEVKLDGGLRPLEKLQDEQTLQP